MRPVPTFVFATAAAAAATLAFAAGHGGLPAEVSARKGHMAIYQLHIATLGGMAQGKIDYDADRAVAAANALAAMTKVDQSAYWTPGTDSESLEGSRAKPAIWDNIPEVIQISQDMSAAADALAAVAGDGVDALKANIGPVGKGCSDCHEDYRVPRR